MGTLEGRTIFITGVARGQGRNHAITVAREGGDVVGLDLCGEIEGIGYPLATEEDLAETVRLVEEADGNIHAEVADVRDQAALDAVAAAGVQRFGKLDGVVANAGIWVPGASLLETEEPIWKEVVDICLTGVWRTIKATAPHLSREKYGSIVLISSCNGLETSDGFGSYVAAKHGVIGLTKQAAYELGPDNIRVNAIAPGAIDTRIWNNEQGYRLVGGSGRAEAIDACYAYSILAGRTALPMQATSNAVIWLLSDLAEHITGTVLPIDAGHLIHPGWNQEPIKEGPLADRYRPREEAPI